MQLLPHQKEQLAKWIVEAYARESLTYYPAGYVAEHLANTVEEWLLQVNDPHTFTDQVFEKDTVKRRCNLGHWHCIRPFHVRRCFPWALYALTWWGPQTSTEIAEKAAGQYSENAARSVRTYTHEMRHFGLITGEPFGKYAITPLGREWYAGRVRIPSKVWPESARLPEEFIAAQNVKSVNVDEIGDKDWPDAFAHDDSSAQVAEYATPMLERGYVVGDTVAPA
jgi:hypothetical protein